MRAIISLIAVAMFYSTSYATQQYASNWRSLGPVNMPYFETSMGRVNCVVASPNNPGKLYLGTPAGGVWSSDDAGAIWIPRSDSLPTLGVSSIVIDPNNPLNIFIASGDADAGDTYSVGVLKSTDGGTNWLNTGLSWSLTSFQSIYKLILSPSDSRRMIAATTDGIYSTVNGGTNWQRATPGGNTYWYDVQFQPGSSSIVYATAKGANFFKSLDGGTSWSQITLGLPSSGVGRSIIAVSSVNPSGVYLLYTGATDYSYYGLYQSIDGGNSFALRSATTGGYKFYNQGWYDVALAVSPSNFNEIYVGGVLIGKSIDGGVTWQSTPYDGTHVDVHDLTFLNGVLYACTDGGVHKTQNGTASWQDLSATLQIGEIYHVGGAQQDSSLVYIGEQDNGLDRYQSGSWSHVYPGDFGQPIVDPVDENTVYAMAHSTFFKSTSGWTDFNPTQLQIAPSETAAWEPPLAMSPADHLTLFAGFQNVWKTTNGGATWSAISMFQDTYTCQVITVAPSNSLYIYVVRGNELWRTIDGGFNWTNISGNQTVLWNVADVAVSASDPNKIWVAQNNGTTSKIFYSPDGSANWIAFTGSLPNRNVRRLIYQEGSNDGLFVALDVGVYYRNANMSDWQEFIDNLPNAPVNDLQINYGSRKLRAGTYGRGLWETDLPVQSPVLNFTISGGNLELSWTNPTFVLEQSPALSSPTWSTIASNSPVQVPLLTGQQFFRLRQ